MASSTEKIITNTDEIALKGYKNESKALIIIASGEIILIPFRPLTSIFLNMTVESFSATYSKMRRIRKSNLIHSRRIINETPSPAPTPRLRIPLRRRFAQNIVECVRY